ncbi:MAG: hypothetical protein HOV80_19070 [Polyangiaceae bacterium]|nr:hypothetical protein [Polyangiaceae bacterium]
MELANIGSEGVERRLRNSISAFGVAIITIVALRTFHAPVWGYGTLVLPFWLSAFLVYQGLFKT